ncbi:hypothetical protein B0I35DRAFT_473709 [Stachybotrys elegans]|uniref:BTB domain-containing protein n=1 Tax=Stachybotrys elegans TaxID=80388 RepID=A0A8K0WXB4_9HYPO|nr:hypothetical protein B0I35DRAFT_473709 [Stachybotrys elegans]
MVSTIAPLQPRPYGANRSADHAVKKPSHSHAHDMTTVLIGPKQAKFKVNKKLLCASSSFFRQQLEDAARSNGNKSVSLWLPSESPAMFGLFVEWLHSRRTFRNFLDDAIHAAYDSSHQAAQDFHWALVHLHLFASHLSIYYLQDLAMDAVQDLYLRCDWDVPPSLIAYLYTKCEPLQSVRLRRWAVAMVAFSLATGGSGSNLMFHPEDAHDEEADPMRFQPLLDTLPEFAMDYTMHLRKLRASRLDIRLKNPQLRIPANKLRNDERSFGFRECSFHSHRAAVGQRRCPHEHELVSPDSVTSTFDSLSSEADELERLSAPARRLKPMAEQPSYPSSWEDDIEQALGHVRSISSTR